jgi:glycosyltransferase involved in cell wall biosynthesis
VRVGFVTVYDPVDRGNWSGVANAIMHSLINAGAVVEPLGPLDTQYQILGRIKSAFYRRLLKQTYDYGREKQPCFGYARQISAKLASRKYDILVSPGAVPVSRLRCDQPIVIWTDATFASYISHYGLAKTLCAETLRAGHATERAAFERAALLIFASQWAANSAIADYKVEPSKIAVVPFGANLLYPPDRKLARRYCESRPVDRCELISIGVDWVRKGMPRAIELAEVLNKRELPTKLTIVGCKPPMGVGVPAFVNLLGFIDKRAIEGEKRIGAVLSRSHFHVLFSSAEAFGVVFAEANAYGVPNIAFDIGGVGSAVVNGRGGHRFSQDTAIEIIADYIESQVRDGPSYQELALRARHEFEHRLNWSVSGAEVARRAHELLPRGHRSCRDASMAEGEC